MWISKQIRNKNDKDIILNWHDLLVFSRTIIKINKKKYNNTIIDVLYVHICYEWMIKINKIEMRAFKMCLYIYCPFLVYNLNLKCVISVFVKVIKIDK